MKNRHNQARIPRFFNCALNLERKLAATIWRRHLNAWNMFSGDERDRTANLLVANQALSSAGLRCVWRGPKLHLPFLYSWLSHRWRIDILA